MPLIIQPYQSQVQPQLQGQPRGQAVQQTDYTGAALGQMSEVLTKAHERIQSRTDAIELARDDGAFYEKHQAELLKRSTEQDFSRPQAIGEFVASIDNDVEEIVSRHAGSEDSKVRLRVALQNRKNSFVSQASAISIQAQKTQVTQFVDRHLNSLSKKVQDNPAALFEAMSGIDATVQGIAGGLTAQEETATVLAGKARLATDAITSFAVKEETGAARDILNHPLFDEIFNDEERRRLSNFIATKESEFKAIRGGGAGGKPATGTPGPWGTDDVNNLIYGLGLKYRDGYATREEKIQLAQSLALASKPQPSTHPETGAPILIPPPMSSYQQQLKRDLEAEMASPSFGQRASDRQSQGAGGLPIVGRRSSDTSAGAPKADASKAGFAGGDQNTLKEILRINDPNERVAAYEAFTTNRTQPGGKGAEAGSPAYQPAPSTPERDAALQEIGSDKQQQPPDTNDTHFDTSKNTTYGKAGLIFGPYSGIKGFLEESAFFPVSSPEGKAALMAQSEAETQQRDLITSLRNTRAYKESEDLEKKFGFSGKFFTSAGGGRAKMLGVGIALQEEYRENLKKLKDPTATQTSRQTANDVHRIIKSYIRKTFGYIAENVDDFNEIPVGAEYVDASGDRDRPGFGSVLRKTRK